MHHHLHLHLKQKPLGNKIPKGLRALFANYIIIDLATGLFAVFLPIFLYEFFNKNLQLLLTYYLASYLATSLIVIVGARKLNKIGFRNSLKISIFIAAFFYMSLYFLKQENAFYLIPLTLVFMSLKRFLYWIPYNIDFAKFADKKSRGSAMGLLEAILSITGVVTPLVAGFVIKNYGFNYLFLIGVVIFLISYLPLIFLPRTKEKFSWSISKTIKKILAKENRTTALVFFAEGAESVIFFIIWPIFILNILNGDYLQVGFLSTITVVITVFAQFIAGKKADGDKKKKDKLVKYGGFFYSVAWLLKIFILTALHIFIIDIFHKLTQIFYKIPLNTLVFEKAANQKHLVDEFIVFREICLNLGRVAMLAVILSFSFWISLNWLFVFGAGFALFEAFYHRNLYCSLR